MIKHTLAALTAATFVLGSAAAFAATPMPATPAITKVAAQTSKKTCEKEWTTGQKGGKLNGLDQKDFLAKCVKGA